MGRVHASFTEGQEGFDLKEGWLFDNRSTDDIACSKDVVIPGSICRVFHHLHLETNAGTLVVEHKCRIKGYPRELWFSDKGLAIIFSFKYVRKCYPQLKISYEVKASIFTIHRQNSNLSDMVFPILECGLHYYHPSSDGMVLVNTVANKKEMFTKREIEGADKAVSLQAKLAFPSKKALKWVIQLNQIQNCPVTVPDVEVAEQINGKSVPALKGKTVRSRPPPVLTEIIKISRDVLKLHKDLIQGMDIFFVNKQPFFITLTLKIYFTTVHLPNRKIATIFKEWKRTYVYYFI